MGFSPTLGPHHTIMRIDLVPCHNPARSQWFQVHGGGNTQRLAFEVVKIREVHFMHPSGISSSYKPRSSKVLHSCLQQVSWQRYQCMKGGPPKAERLEEATTSFGLSWITRSARPWCNSLGYARMLRDTQGRTALFQDLLLKDSWDWTKFRPQQAT